ncbi:flagellar biosynthetic protein FliR [Sphingomonas jatrophae]|uniref:Flagellar biosynthetic protein FliR n=1 Tax=Sphingomonas jatrophae TaxID=1166337 RepID=A0A1I6MBK4_9SPHN|nr:flagellar biosynthetic protein FliR [Sphingomonas jatrophae]SFS12978.1 flagellar biosynthetic protein FliR [Sphingomonas jatrophae]
MNALIPGGFAGLEAQLWLWLVAMIRPGAAFVAAPVFGAPQVPLQVRLVIALAVGMPGLAAGGFDLPAAGVVSPEGVLMILGEVLIGLAIGFAVQIGFSAALVAGETISNAMGLGFSSMIDPSTDQGTPALGSFLSVLGTLLFLSLGGHLMLAAILLASYRTLPIGGPLMGAEPLHDLVLFGGQLFAAGLMIALPVGFALILVQLVMAMLARSAPALNLFAVGLPAALMAGIVLLAIAAPVIADGIVLSLQAGLATAERIAGG